MRVKAESFEAALLILVFLPSFLGHIGSGESRLTLEIVGRPARIEVEFVKWCTPIPTSNKLEKWKKGSLWMAQLPLVKDLQRTTLKDDQTSTY